MKITRALVSCFLLILCLRGNLCISISDEDSLGKIVFANVLFRHGDRTPTHTYRKDPYRNESLWPVPFGQLTNTGKHQHLMLGRWLRNRYAQLLPQNYSAHDIYVLSSDVDRTLMSAEANLAGLYPPNGNQVWDIHDWMPIPVHTVPKKKDQLLAAEKHCEKYKHELHKVLHSPEIKKIKKENAILFRYLTIHSGSKIASLRVLKHLYIILWIENLYNKTLPQWTERVYPEPMKSLAEKSFMIPTYNKILQRLKSGPLLKNMIKHMIRKIEQPRILSRKLMIYSAHDSTIANMLMSLNLFEPHCPPYAATLLIELRVNVQNEYVVTIFYKNSTEEPTLMTLPGCSSACPLDEFISLTKDVVPENWERECSIGSVFSVDDTT